MNDPQQATLPAREQQPGDPMPPSAASNLRNFCIALLVLLAVFSLPLRNLVQFALGSELYSHLWLIPFVSAGLVWLNRSRLPPPASTRVDAWTIGLLLAGLGMSVWYMQLLFSGTRPPEQDLHAVIACALMLLVAGLVGVFLGRQLLRALAFPLGLLVFMAPFPLSVEVMLENFLQVGSSLTAHGMFVLSGMPFMRDGTFFRLPGFSMEVAPECSGIHSTLALFLTSLVAGQVLLRSPWKRVILTLIVLPIALIRNGLRVFTIGQLCVRIGPEMIDSWIHRQGGPFFFALSLIPFGLILLYLIRTERSSRQRTASPSLR